ncbi:MAG TPA: ATP-binding protein, partial [Spirochaetia bacterium]
GQLAGGIAHDFNNLLQTILGYAALARESLPQGSEPRVHVEEILRASERARALVGKLITFARREETGRIFVDLDELVDGMTDVLRRAVGDTCGLATVTDGHRKLVKADTAELEQALVNLCLNAKDAMENGGVIRVETGTAELDDGFCRGNPWARPGRWAVLTVSDTGTGMSTEALAHLFEPFYTTKPRGRGTGLGAAVVYGIVTHHDGLIHVRSAEGKGTSVAIYLPLVETVAPRATAAPIPAPDRGTETILLAEDDDAVREFAKRVLQGAGYAVLAARDGAEAIDLFERRGEDLALAVLDVIMPKSNGTSVAARIHAVRPAMPVLFCTGHDFRLLDDGQGTAVGVLRKPFAPGDLLRRVRAGIDGAGRGES